MQYREDYLNAPGIPPAPSLPHKQVHFDPQGVEMSSPYYVSCAFQNFAEAERWKREEVDAVLTEARSGGLDHFFETIRRFSTNFPTGIIQPLG